MAAPIGGPDADESKSRNAHIPSIFDIRTSITQLSSSAAESMISKDIGSGDGKEHHGTIPLASSSATPPRRAYRAKMGDVAIEVINEREKRSRMRRNAESQGNVEVYNQIPQRKHMRNVLTRMEEYTTGPFSLLYRSVKEKRKVKVWTRSFKFIRGICTGYVVAYDKHWNLAMSDVDEIYKNPSVKRKAKSDGKKQKKKKSKQKTPQDKETDEVIIKAEETQDEKVVDSETQKLEVKSFTDAGPEAEQELADIKYMVLKDTNHGKTTMGNEDKMTQDSKEDNKVTPDNNEDNESTENKITQENENDNKSTDKQLLMEEEIEEDEEDLESLALKLNKLKEELGEISVKEEHLVDTLPDEVKTEIGVREEFVDRMRHSGQEHETSCSSHLSDSSRTKTEQSGALSHDGLRKSSLKEERLQCERQHNVYISEERRLVSVKKETVSSANQTDGKTDDADRNTKQVDVLLKRHINQLFIRGDNVVMVALVP
ncbi:hypothetical protein LSAT2_021325 [Lamellibrachia satsuma]|nr:hypothetical protein LSAT2_021325 [Lamellibrachia satsuma]